MGRTAASRSAVRGGPWRSDRSSAPMTRGGTRTPLVQDPGPPPVASGRVPRGRHIGRAPGGSCPPGASLFHIDAARCAFPPTRAPDCASGLSCRPSSRAA
jgi:hypothetical protein